MSRRRWLFGILAAILAAVVTVVWVKPLVLGPEVACGLAPSPCEDPEFWPAFQAWQAEGRFQWLPVTRVSPGRWSGGCGSWYV